MNTAIIEAKFEAAGCERAYDPRVCFAVATLLGVSPEQFRWPEWLTYGGGASAGRKRGVRIVPSGFFGPQYGTAKSIPALPVRQSCGVPVLFGNGVVERIGDELVVGNDIIAGAYFLLTRYEEMVRPEVRDQHGRFPGKESLAYRAGFLRRPLVDEYAALLRRWLATVGIPFTPAPVGIQKVYLTHDVDWPWAWWTFRDCARVVVRRRIPRDRHLFDPFLSLFGISQGRDPHDSFDWILDQDMALRAELGAGRVESVFFLIASSGGPKDGLNYLGEPRMQQLVDKMLARGAKVGLHATYEAGGDPRRIPAERAAVEAVTRSPVVWNRHHFLRCREPGHLSMLSEAGITDDFTMGYADIVGFRVGTCRPYRWFDPATQRLHRLTVHPMTVMECTLDRGAYMGLSYDEALAVCSELLEQTGRHSGEAVLLWHNTEVTESSEMHGSYQRRLYVELLSRLRGVRGCHGLFS